MKRLLFILSISILLPTLFSCSKKDDNLVVTSTEIKQTDENVELSDNDDKSVYDLAQGMKMPNVKVETNKGVAFDLNKTKKPVLINFWATWCPPCRMEMPGLQNLYEEFGDKVDFVMINLGETKDTIQDFLVENEVYTFPIGYDETDSYGMKFSIVGIPTTYIIGKDKIIKNYIVGARDEDQFREYLEEVIKN